MLIRFIALFILFLLLPLFLIISLIILCEDGFPIFFKQQRVGINQSLFNLYKFRSMKKNTPNVATHLLINPNNYILKIGKFIRKSSIDEIPNLLNIVKGEMTFIGPRPALFNQNDLINLRISKGIDKLKPGITGWAQINGRDMISLEEKVKLEHEYLLNKSLLLDFKILFKTFSNILFSKSIAH